MSRHLRRFPRIILDGVRINRRRKRGKTTEFSAKAKAILADLPRYYRRNFHFQTDGYLSENSAALYEHQVEILFRGAADAMRRLMLPQIKKALGTNDGQGMTFLEIGAGTGAATRFVRLAFPKAKIVVSDLSGPYLKEAQKRLARFSRIDFVEADGAALPFKDGSFDFVYSIFLHHELPENVREQVIAESRRVLKPSGWVATVDSLQEKDRPSLAPVLESFPNEYHEPFYRNYLESPTEKLLKRQGFFNLKTAKGFFAKSIIGQA